MNNRKSNFWAGLRAEIPLLIGGFPFGLLYGALAVSSDTARALVAVRGAEMRPWAPWVHELDHGEVRHVHEPLGCFPATLPRPLARQGQGTSVGAQLRGQVGG